MEPKDDQSDRISSQLRLRLPFRIQFFYPVASRTHVWNDFETLAVVFDRHLAVAAFAVQVRKPPVAVRRRTIYPDHVVEDHLRRIACATLVESIRLRHKRRFGDVDLKSKSLGQRCVVGGDVRDPSYLAIIRKLITMERSAESLLLPQGGENPRVSRCNG